MGIKLKHKHNLIVSTFIVFILFRSMGGALRNIFVFIKKVDGGIGECVPIFRHSKSKAKSAGCNPLK